MALTVTCDEPGCEWEKSGDVSDARALVVALVEHEHEIPVPYSIPLLVSVLDPHHCAYCGVTWPDTRAIPGERCPACTAPLPRILWPVEMPIANRIERRGKS